MAVDPRVLAMMQMQQQGGMPQGPQGMPMPQPGPQSEPDPTIPDEMTDEDMLNNVQSQMGGHQVMGQDMQTDQMCVEQAPTDENITAFVDAWGEENLPEGMQGARRGANDDDGDEAMGD